MKTENDEHLLTEQLLSACRKDKRWAINHMNTNTETPGKIIEILTSKRADLNALARKHGASNIRIFGSVAI